MIRTRRATAPGSRRPGRMGPASLAARYAPGLLLVALGGCAPALAPARTPGEAACARALRREADEVWNKGRLGVIPEIVRDSAVIWVRGSRGFVTHEEIRQGVAAWRAAFPDLVKRVDDVVAEGDRVATRVTATGTHRGPFFGIPPTGRSIRIDEMSIARCENGLIVEGWLVEGTDPSELMELLRAPARGTGTAGK